MSTKRKPLGERLTSSTLGQTIGSPASNQPVAERPAHRNTVGNSLAGVTSTRQLTGALIVPLAMLSPNPNQIRKNFEPVALQELADDITHNGILEPLLVREKQPGEYEIVAGERRYRAAGLAGLKEVPVLVKKMSDDEAQLTTLLENIQRADLLPDEEQAFYRQLQARHNYSIKQIAALVHKSYTYVRNRLEGELKELQPAPAPEIDSEISNNISRQDILSKKSQIEGSKKSAAQAGSAFKPSAFKKFYTTVDTALALFESEQPVNEKVRQQLREDVSRLREKLAELEQKLD